MSGILSPTIWARQAAKSLTDKPVLKELLRNTPLRPNDTWAPTGETYEEACAWARLLNVTVTRPGGEALLVGYFTLTSLEKVPRLIEACSPGELIDVLRYYATESPWQDVDASGP